MLYAIQDAECARELLEFEKKNLYAIRSAGIGERHSTGLEPIGLEHRLQKLERRTEEHARAIDRYEAELAEAEEILGGVEDAKIKTLSVMLWVMRLPAEEIKRRLNMTEYTFKKIKTQIEEADSFKDFLEKREKNAKNT